MSAIRQAVRDKSPDCRKSAALRNALAENPRALTRPTTASRADSSSSIMEIGRFTDAHTFRCLGCWPRCGRPCGAHAGRSCAMERMGKIDWWVQLYRGFGRLRLCDTDGQPVGVPHEIGQRIRLHLAHYLRTVDLDRDLAELEFRGNLLVQLTGGHQHHDFPLARSEEHPSELQSLLRKSYG